MARGMPRCFGWDGVGSAAVYLQIGRTLANHRGGECGRNGPGRTARALVVEGETWQRRLFASAVTEVRGRPFFVNEYSFQHSVLPFFCL